MFTDMLVQSKGPGCLHSTSGSATFLVEKLNFFVLQFPQI